MTKTDGGFQMKSFDETWEEIHSTQDWGQYPSEHVIRFVARNYYRSDRANTKILDFCCGGGAHTWYLAREGFDVFAFDGSKSAVMKVQKKLEKEGLSAKLDVYDAAETNYSDDFFDAVIDNVSVYANTSSNIRVMYEHIFNMLKKGGKLFTSVFTEDTTGALSGEKIEEHTYRNLKDGNLSGRGIVHFFDREEMIRLLSEIGFINIVIDTLVYTDNGTTVSMLIVQTMKPE